MLINIKDEVYDIRWRHERINLSPEGLVPCISSKGGRTVAYIMDKKGKPIEAYAECSIKDSYNKKLGRLIATGRLFKILGLDTNEAKRICFNIEG